MYKFVILLIALCFVGCGKKSDFSSDFSIDTVDNKTNAAIVCVIPEGKGIYQELSKYVANNIKDKLEDSGSFLVQDVIIKYITNHDEIFTNNNSLDQLRIDNRLVIFLSLLKHNLTPTQSIFSKICFNKIRSYTMDVSLQIQMMILDNQDGDKIILQEILQNTFYLPWLFDTQNNLTNSTLQFLVSPFHIRHNSISNICYKRIHKYFNLFQEGTIY